MIQTRSLPRLALLTALSILVLACSKESDIQTEQPMHRPPVNVPAFDGDRAMELLVAQTAFGPRVPGTPAHDSCRQFILTMAETTAASVSQQRFSFPGYDSEALNLTNIIARFKPDAAERILLAAHWDSRPRADREEDPEKQKLPVPGANDGASGVAVLLQLASILADASPPIGVDLLFFDGEDYGHEGDESMFCIGSKYYAATIGLEQKYRFGILLDLVGDREAEFKREQFSDAYAKDINDFVFSRAAALGLPQFVNVSGSAVLDDHVSLNITSGIRTVNIIDAELVGHMSENPRRKYWHTLNDTAEQCSAETLQSVGTLLLDIIYGMQPSAIAEVQ